MKEQSNKETHKKISQNRSSGRVFGRITQQRSTQGMSQNRSSARVQEAQKEMIPLSSLIPEPSVDSFPSSSQSTEKEDKKVDEVLNESTDVCLPPATLFSATVADADRKSKKTKKRLVHRSETSKDKPKPTGGDHEISKEFSANISPPSILFNDSAAPTADASAVADNGGGGNLEDSKKISKHYSEPTHSWSLELHII
ncbi:hypothetical protein HELRODRAFT_193232 [Helobdella robusta]|uniref:Uncharacterized protein n=1 Tax=Helobdella robusta TaxID=6412 RepID=T1FUR8_HELRO|nr:hypothetical protein HELRODRAFT_193232 [Helobdella robusta]ESN97521.1 hypothetical protein HELRODRAFT_193232 [Helobdella robusta]